MVMEQLNKNYMRNKLDYIYYRFYRFQVAVGNGNVAFTFSFIFLSFLVMLNFFAFTFILYAFLDIRLPFKNPVIGGLTVLGVIFLINFFLFIYGKRYLAIINRYKNEPLNTVKKGNFAVISYMIFSFGVIGLSFYLMIMRNRGLL